MKLFLRVVNAVGWTPFPDLDDVLWGLVALSREVLGDDLVGVYLQGSFAIGDADEHSDVDFLVVVRDGPTETQRAALQAGHARLFSLPTEWAKHLEGSYFPIEHLRQPTHTGENLWYFDNGSLVPEWSDHDDTLVVRWTMREHGIALWGPPARTLIDPIPTDALKAEVRTTIRDWGGALLQETPGWLNTRWGQPYLVLSFCRMRHTLATGRVESKRAGAIWAREALGPKWRGLIDGALADRPDPWKRAHQPADPALVARTLEFVEDAVTLPI